MEPGMTFTIEPMLTLGGMDWVMLGRRVDRASPADGSWVAQWEHTARRHRPRGLDPHPANARSAGA